MRINKIRKSKSLILVFSILFSSINILPFFSNAKILEAAEFGMSADYLIQIGINFLDQGRFYEAAHEFKKALIVDPRSALARDFLRQTEMKLSGQGIDISKEQALTEALMSIEKKDGKFLKRESVKGVPFSRESVSPSRAKSITPEKTIILDEAIKAVQPNAILELSLGSSAVIRGNKISRFVNASPDKLEVSRLDQNSILVISKDVGSGIFHIWDSQGRWTLKYKWIQSPLVQALQEEYEKRTVEASLSSPFKISYSFDRSTFHTGRRIDTTERRSSSFDQSVAIRGETPYGKFDASTSLSRLNKDFEVNSLTAGLSDGNIGKLKNFNLRLFDFSPGISGYKFPSSSLRGAAMNVSMFNRKLYYSLFWGGIPEGNYTRLQPGLGTTKDAYLEGVGLSYNYSKNARYKFYFAHTYGEDLNDPVLTDKAFGLGAFHKIGKFYLNSDVAYDDADHISYTSRAGLNFKKCNFFLSFTEDDRDFVSPFGGSASGGTTNANFSMGLFPNPELSISNSFSAVRDRLFPNPDDPKRPNYNMGSTISWQMDPHTSLNLSYGRDDTRGTISPSITTSQRFGIRKKVFFIKPINTFLSYSRSRNKYFTGSSSNHDRDGIGGGLSLRLLDNLYWSISKNIYFIENRVSGATASSHVLDTSLSYSSRILDSPFYGNFRLSFRDEEETESVLSLLSGEDRFEFFGELNYRPNSDFESFLSLRVANVWAENVSTTKHLDAEIRYGVRFVWDTDIRWNTKGHTEGFVFNDLNDNGKRDEGEEGIAGVKIIAQEDKIATTNKKGYYKIKNIVGTKAQINIDLSTIPKGYILSSPSFEDIDIVHGTTQEVAFGVSTHSEIVGVAFVDANANGEFDRREEGFGGVIIILDNKERIMSDQNGQYLIRDVSPGKHTIKLDLKSIPTNLIPQVPLKKEVDLKEGTTFFYNIPLKQTQIVQ